MKKIYFVNGFLEAGKTSFIKNLLEQDYFNTGEPTLLLVCEEGIEDYEEEFCQEHNLILKNIDSEEDFLEESVELIESENTPERIIVEFNGMWNPRNEVSYWQGNQIMQIVIIDASLFELYLNNMKSYLMQQIRNAYMVVFRSCDGKEKKLASYRRNIRAVNPKVNFVFKNKKGEMNPRLDEDLPYDINSKKIYLSERTFGIFYIDAMEYVTRYTGKIVNFTGIIFNKKKNMLLIGRKAMTCCMEDLTVFAFISDLDSTELFEIEEWVKVEGRIEAEYFTELNASIPVLHILWIEKCMAPEKEIVEVY